MRAEGRCLAGYRLLDKRRLMIFEWCGRKSDVDRWVIGPSIRRRLLCNRIEDEAMGHTCGLCT